MTPATKPRWWLLCLVTTIAGLGVTVAVVLYGGLRFSFAAPVVRGVLETTVTIIGGLVAFLAVGRFRRRREPADLAIALAVGALALNYPVFVALPSLAGGIVRDVGTWMYLVSHASAAGLLCWASGQSVAAPFGSDEGEGTGPAVSVRPALHRTGLRRPLRGVPVPLYVVTTSGLATLLLLSSFGFDPDATTGAAHPSAVGFLSAQPGPPIVRLIAFVLFLVAAGRFSWHNHPGTDHLIGWLGVGCSMLAVGDLEYAFYPPASHGDLHLGDVFRLGAVLVFAVGAASEIHSYWRGNQELARLEARRAVAADLHDGIAQELALLASLVRRGPGSPSDLGTRDRWLDQVRAATDRALVESRRAIAALIADEPFGLGGDLEKVVREIAPLGVDVRVDVESRWVERVDRDALVLIVREAVRNAVRHGRPTAVSVEVTGDRWPVVRVVDDGAGFDLATAPKGGFGIVTMRERARAAGGVLSIDSAYGRGTVVEVSWGPGRDGANEGVAGADGALGLRPRRRRGPSVALR